MRERLRTIGPYEEWSAQRDDQWFVFRRPHPERPDQQALHERLAASSARLKDRNHPHLLACHGLGQSDEPPSQGQLLEAAAGCPLDQLPVAEVPSLLVMHDVLCCLHDGHTNGLDHGALTPAHIHLGLDGNVRVDFGLAPGAYGGAGSETLTEHVDLRFTRADWLAADHGLSHRLDVFAAVKICLGSAPKVSEATKVLFQKALGETEGSTNAKELAEALRKELDGSARIDLQSWLIDHLEKQAKLLEAPAAQITEDVRKTGAFTRMLRAQKAEIVPQPLLQDLEEAPIGNTDKTVPPEGMLAVGMLKKDGAEEADPVLPPSQSVEASQSALTTNSSRRLARGLTAFGVGFLLGLVVLYTQLT